ncbi:MAG: hypothetical protein M9894_08770 [Planctomycetes bacterium]|nr:hypothetical protein [Planctomycetota bacterium]
MAVATDDEPTKRFDLSLARSDDGWEHVLAELRRQAVAETLSTLDLIWRE